MIEPASLSREELLILIEDRWGRATEYDLRYARWQAALLAAGRAAEVETAAYVELQRAIEHWRGRYGEPKAIGARAVAERDWEAAHAKLRACDRRASRLYREMMEVVR